MDSSSPNPHADAPGKPAKASKPLVSNRTARVINTRDAIDVAEDSSLAMAPWFMAALSLPYRDPGTDLVAWERTNGTTRITITPYVKEGKAHYPYGVYPRLLLTWMTTEAIKTGSNEIQIADGLRAFMRQIGATVGGKQKTMMLAQMQRLFNAHIRIETVEEVIRDGEPLTHVVTKNFQFTDEHDLWLKDSESVEWGSTVTLSPKFYASLVNHSFPVYADALQAIGNSAFCLDIYLFLVSRLYRLKKRTRISWTQLNEQFGGRYSEVKAFKRDFLKHLKTVQIIYPEAKVAVESKCLILLPSKQHVPSRVAAGEITASAG